MTNFFGDVFRQNSPSYLGFYIFAIIIYPEAVVKSEVKSTICHYKRII